MIDRRAAKAADATPAGGFDPERGVFIFPEGDIRPGVKAGVALMGPNGRRVPPRKPIVLCDPARKPPRRRCPRPRPRPGELTVAGWILISAVIVTVAAAAAASCIGSF